MRALLRRWVQWAAFGLPAVARAAAPAGSPAEPPPGVHAPPAQPSFWAERAGETLRVSVDARGVFDEAWRARLRSGLACVVAVEARLREHDGRKVRGRLRRIVRVRWDLWAERMRREPGGEADFSATEWPSMDAFLEEVAHLRAVPMGDHIATDERAYFVDVRVELNPWSTQAKALPAGVQGVPRGPGTPERVFDTLLHWAEAWEPGQAERSASATGQPFRGDRLPTFRAGAAP